MMMPRVAAYSDLLYTNESKCHGFFQPALSDAAFHIREADVFIMLTDVAFAAGVKIGSGSFSACCRPCGKVMPQTAPVS
jgi:hypothetical protein